MKSNQSFQWLGWVSLCALTACSSIHSTTDDTLLSASEETATVPFVEAYLEQVGPPSRWAGPSSFVVHVTAKEKETARVALFPSLHQTLVRAAPLLGVPVTRGLASASSATKAEALEASVAREQLHVLSQMVQQESAYQGCMYPLRVRLIRKDGTSIEKYGCRSDQGWPQFVSQMMSRWIEVAVHTPGRPARVAPSVASVQR